MKKIIIGVALAICLILVIVLCVSCSKKEDTPVENTEYKQLDGTNVIIPENITIDGEIEGVKLDENGNLIVEDGLVELEVPVSNNDIYESDSDVGSTDKKQEAIDLVKEEWGPDDTVSFRCDSVTSNGEYIIAVVSKETTSVKNYFIVNLENKTVEVDY